MDLEIIVFGIFLLLLQALDSNFADAFAFNWHCHTIKASNLNELSPFLNLENLEFPYISITILDIGFISSTPITYNAFWLKYPPFGSIYVHFLHTCYISTTAEGIHLKLHTRVRGQNVSSLSRTHNSALTINRILSIFRRNACIILSLGIVERAVLSTALVINYTWTV